ncbi:MAG TPA: hypothetical protein VMV32_09510, partial [Ignavibacteriaceae bacterium]|nr:hypothetical protein [Ignavibacteriaceae bacterium]
PGKNNRLSIEANVREFMREINKLHRIVGNGDLIQIEKLESMNADEYYSTIDTFLQEHEEKESHEEKRKSS